MKRSLLALMAGVALASACPAWAQPVRFLEAADLRAEPSPSAPLVGSWAAGRRVELLGLRGGWAQVRDQATTAWVRASVVDTLPALVAGTAAAETGRRASGNEVVSLGVRRYPAARPNRHALIIGVGSYVQVAERQVEPLPGVVHDMSSALEMARLLQVPLANTTLLRDEAATRDGVAAAIRDLSARMNVGDRVFVYWAGHGSRFLDRSEGGCVESLIPHDLRDISNRDFASWIQPVGAKADKMLVVFDACHSAGVSSLSRSLGTLRPRAAGVTDACGIASNVRTRSLSAAVRSVGLEAADVVHIASARPDEVSFENSLSGGLATAGLRDCMAGAAVDADGSGAITMAEVVSCVQAKVDTGLAPYPQLSASHVTLSGNASFVPALFAAAPPTLPAPAPAAVATSVATSLTTPGGTPSGPAPASPAPVAILDVVKEVFEQRDAKWRVDAASPSRIRIGARLPGWTVTSQRDGYLYVVMVGSDRSSLYLLFPNDLDSDNRIAAGVPTQLPRSTWSVRAGGPPGVDNVMVLVSDGPRDLKSLAGVTSVNFSMPLTDLSGRIQLQRVFGSNVRADGAACEGKTGCSDSFGATMLTIEEFE